MLASYIDIHTCHVWARLKEISVCKGQIEPLFCEGALCEVKAVDWDGIVDSKLMCETKAARKAMHSFVEDNERATAAEIRTALTKHNRALQALDKQWRIESNFFLSQIGESGELRMQGLVLEGLPSPGNDISVKAARDAIKLLAEGALFQFVGLALQRSVTTTVHWLDTMLASRPPNIPKSGTDDFTTKVILSMSYFARHQLSADDATKWVYGKEAIESKFAVIEAVVAEKQKVDLEQLRPLGLFKWLLSSKQQTQLKEWTTLTMAGVVVQAPKKTTAYAKASRNGPASKKRKTDAESAMEWADSMF